MPEFLAETYTPREALAAAHAASPQDPARFLGANAVPAEETCFYLYQAPAAPRPVGIPRPAGPRPEPPVPPACPGGRPGLRRICQDQARTCLTARRDHPRPGRPPSGPSPDVIINARTALGGPGTIPASPPAAGTSRGHQPDLAPAQPGTPAPTHAQESP